MRELKPDNLASHCFTPGLWTAYPNTFPAKAISKASHTPTPVKADTEVTYGCIVYQNRYYRYSRNLGVFMGQADILRRHGQKEFEKMKTENAFIYGRRQCRRRDKEVRKSPSNCSTKWKALPNTRSTSPHCGIRRAAYPTAYLNAISGRVYTGAQPHNQHR